jgi:cell division protein FtsL
MLGPSVLALATAVGLVTWARTGITALRYELTRLLEQETVLRAGVEKLKIEEAALASPGRIQQAARAMGLRDPSPGQLVPLPPEARRP